MSNYKFLQEFSPYLRDVVIGSCQLQVVVEMVPLPTYQEQALRIFILKLTWKIDFKETMTDERHEAIGHVNLLR